MGILFDIRAIQVLARRFVVCRRCQINGDYRLLMTLNTWSWTYCRFIGSPRHWLQFLQINQMTFWCFPLLSLLKSIFTYIAVFASLLYFISSLLWFNDSDKSSCLVLRDSHFSTQSFFSETFWPDGPAYLQPLLMPGHQWKDIQIYLLLDQFKIYWTRSALPIQRL